MLWPALVNGFPFVYSDTSTYISSGFELKTPIDRPIVYGLFIRLAGLNGLSIWGVVFLQSFIVVYLIRELLIRCFDITSTRFYLLLLFFLTLFTALPWVCCLLLPDIFTPVLVLSALIIAFERYKKINFLHHFIFLFSCAMHLSHFLFALVFILTLYLFRKKIAYQTHSKSGWRFSLLFLLVGLSIVPALSALSKSKHVFFMGAMVEHGIVKTYLDENCADNNYKLCLYKDSLPQKAYEFIWDEKSPFYKTGGWKANKKEFNEIIRATLTQPKYIWLHIRASVKATFDQLTMFKVGDGMGKFDKETLLYKRLGEYFNAAERHEKSLQFSKNTTLFSLPNTIQTVTVVLSLILLLAIFAWRKTHTQLRATVFILAAILWNAWCCGTFANAIDRLGSKMVWLVPCMAFVAVHIFLKEYEKINRHR